MDRIVVHTNFTGRPAIVHTILLKDLAKPENLEIVRAVFHDPEKPKPGVTREGITQDAASRIAAIALTMRDRGLDPHEIARFLDRVVFALFAEDVNLLPDKIFSRRPAHESRSRLSSSSTTIRKTIASSSSTRRRSRATSSTSSSDSWTPRSFDSSAW
jgi:hypothetical protein